MRRYFYVDGIKSGEFVVKYSHFSGSKFCVIGLTFHLLLSRYINIVKACK